MKKYKVCYMLSPNEMWREIEIKADDYTVKDGFIFFYLKNDIVKVYSAHFFVSAEVVQ